MNLIKKHLAIFFLIIICAFIIVFERLHTYDEPLNWDITAKAVIAHELLNGKKLYAEIWDHKPPGIHASYLLAEIIVGYGQQEAFFLNIVFGLLIVCSLLWASKLWNIDRQFSYLPAIAWAIVSGQRSLEANQPNTELFMNAFILLSFCCVLAAHSYKHNKNIYLFLFGLFACLSTIYKHVALAPVAMMFFAYIMMENFSFRSFFSSLFWITTGFVLMLMPLILILYKWAAIDDFLTYMFDYNRFYCGSLYDNIVKAFTLKHCISPSPYLLLPLFICFVFGIFIDKDRWEKWIFALAYFVGVVLAIILPGRFFPHYYQLILLPLIFASGEAIHSFVNRFDNKKVICFMATFFFLALLCYHEYPNYQLSPNEWSKKNFGETFVINRDSANKLSNILLPEETFYQWGTDTGLYFYTKRRPPSDIVHTWAVDNDSFLSPQITNKLFIQLSLNSPEAFLIDPERLSRDKDRNNRVIIWVLDNYEKVGQINSLYLFALKDGALAQRTMKQNLKVIP